MLNSSGRCRFRRNFRDTPWVHTPKVHWGLTTQTILTMEYVPGTKISDVQSLRAAGRPLVVFCSVFGLSAHRQWLLYAQIDHMKLSCGGVSAGLDTKKIAQRVTESYLTQVLTHGFLHSDPHPGNVAVDSDGGLVRTAALAVKPAPQACTCC